jgi:tRNA threonylcarbamoyladenosine biosynthesis protein TsaB
MRLVLDTSSAVSVALLDGAALLSAAHRYDPRRHAELLAAMVDSVLGEAGLTPADLTMVVAGQGPGPFTGLRVALVTARVLGFATGVPVHGVCSLDALALAAARRVAAGDEVLVATDARRREVYWARYRSQGPGLPPHRLGGPAVDPDLADLLDPEATDLGQLAAAELAAGVSIRPPDALYLRRPDAVEKQPAGAGR